MLNENNLIERAPSALTDRPSLTLVKPTYGFVNTSEIVNRFERQGWVLSDAKQARVKTADRQGYQKHLLRFRNEQFSRIDGLKGYSESIPELIVENSHDGKSSLKIFFGVFRIACLNGLISGASLANYRIVHSQNSIKKLDESIDYMTGNIPSLIERVSKFSDIQLSTLEQTLMARKIANIRLKHVKNVDTVDLERMLKPKRHADTSNDAYTVFNILQEKAIRGGIVYSQFNSETKRLEPKTSRTINSVNQSISLNRDMWNVLESVV